MSAKLEDIRRRWVKDGRAVTPGRPVSARAHLDIFYLLAKVDELTGEAARLRDEVQEIRTENYLLTASADESVRSVLAEVETRRGTLP